MKPTIYLSKQQIINVMDWRILDNLTYQRYLIVPRSQGRMELWGVGISSCYHKHFDFYIPIPEAWDDVFEHVWNSPFNVAEAIVKTLRSEKLELLKAELKADEDFPILDYVETECEAELKAYETEQINILADKFLAECNGNGDLINPWGLEEDIQMPYRFDWLINKI